MSKFTVYLIRRCNAPVTFGRWLRGESRLSKGFIAESSHVGFDGAAL